MSLTAPGKVVARAEPVPPRPKQLCVAYLVNRYPKVSHAFIRREIAALEELGVRVERFSLRPCGDLLADQADRSELDKTRVVLNAGLLRLAAACATAAVTRPLRFTRALRLALRMGWSSDRGVLRNLAYLVESCVLLQWFQQRRVDRLHAHFATNPAAVAMLCHVLGGPEYSFTAHGPDDFDRAPALSLNEKIARAQFAVTVSRYGRSQLYRWCDRRQWSKIHVMHPGVDAGFLDCPVVPVPSAPRLVCVGRLDEQKGQLLLLEAVRRLISDGESCELVLVGDGELRAQIEVRISQLQLRAHVILSGALPTGEMRAQIQAARALVVPSFAENLPSVILEAFALHRPVIATFIAGIPEVVETGVNGWLVPPGSVEALAGAIRQALSASVETLQRMGRDGAALVSAEFRSEDAARRLLHLFRSEGRE